MADKVFLTPYQQSKLLSGVIVGNKPLRPNALQQHLGRTETTLRETVNFDKEFGIKNVMGQFVAPHIRAARVQLPNFGTQELTFAYTKELIGSPDYSEISQRMLGQQFGTVQDVQANYLDNIRKQSAYALERIENLHELIARDLFFYGAYTAVSEKHPEIKYNFNRTVYAPAGATEAVRDANFKALTAEIIPEVNLTTLKANTAADVAGGASWDGISGLTGSAITAKVAVDPVMHLENMIRTANYRAGVTEIYMSQDAWTWFRSVLMSDKYKDLRDLTKTAQTKLDPKVIEQRLQVEGLDLAMVWSPNGVTGIPIFIYNGTYNDRTTGTKTKYVPDGYVLLVPPAQYGLKVFGRIMHPKAGWQPMELWMNYWQNEETGLEEWEFHQNLLFGHSDIDSVVCWKVCSSAKAG